MDIKEWLEYGVSKGYCSPQFCDTHEGMPMTDREVAVWENGDDPCVAMVRLGNPEDWNADAAWFEEQDAEQAEGQDRG